MYDVELVQMRSLLLLPSWLEISYVQHDKVSMACFIGPRIPKSNHITSDCSPSLSLRVSGALNSLNCLQIYVSA